ncbi:glycosyltransferase family 4 protein [Patescibacteria group bacterium]|nr:glycosyltransferase family 4 protein [Patescibacteria group bacterium]
MKIAIDISQLVYGTGVSFYTRNLVLSLAKLDQKNDYLLFGYSFRQMLLLKSFVEEVKKINPRFESCLFQIPPSLVELIGNGLHRFFIEKFIGPIDVYHSSDWVQFPSQAFKVTTLHDFSFYTFPQSAHPKIVSVMNRRLKWVESEVDWLIAVSKATARAGVELAGLKRTKMSVVYEAPAVRGSLGEKPVEKMREKYGLKENFFLSVANLDPRKNLKTIIEAFGLFSQKRFDWSLLIVGKVGWDSLKSLGVKNRDRVVLAGYVPEADLVELYVQSAGLVYPSLEEGFGLPILEAMRAQTPVLTSNCSSLSEVAGQAAVLVNPRSVEAVVHGLERLVVEREKLVELGRKRVAEFSWEKAAQETLRVYEKAKE